MKMKTLNEQATEQYKASLYEYEEKVTYQEIREAITIEIDNLLSSAMCGYVGARNRDGCLFNIMEIINENVDELVRYRAFGQAVENESK